MSEDDLSPPSSREIAGEDFLFHLYRGSELLLDNRVHEAKQELEQALSFQPLDAKGQDLLAIVYFRLGLYPRAISIYSELIGAYPQAQTPRINLALCYLKTGQPGAARAELERVIQKDPSHARAWGYLGLAFQGLRDTERAVAAFEAGGHHQMARRLQEEAGVPPSRALSVADREVVSRAATEAFDELDRGEHGALRPDAQSETRSAASGTWAALEPGRENALSQDRRVLTGFVTASESLVPPATRSQRPPPPAPAPAATAEPDPEVVPKAPLAPAMPPEPDPEVVPKAPRTPGSMSFVPASVISRGRESGVPERSDPVAVHSAAQFAREHLLVFPRSERAVQHATGVVLLQSVAGGSGLDADAIVAARLDAVKSMSFGGGVAARSLTRRLRGRTSDEPLGGSSSPLMMLEGVGELVLAAPPGTKLFLISLGDDPLFVRESAVIALEGHPIHENGQLAVGEGDSIQMVQLRGSGTVTLALPASFVALEVREGRSTLVRAHAVLGWTGSTQPRALSPNDAPNRTRGLVSISGAGMVLVDGR